MAGGGTVNAVDPGLIAGAVPVPLIRSMGLADLDRVLALERAVYPKPWSEGIFRDELAAAGRVYLVAEIDGELAGFAGMMVVGEDGHVTNLAVDPGRRRGRVATRLMVELVDRGLAAGARHLTLEVRVSNRSAQRLYARFGMAPVGVRKDYYIDEDALIMWVTDIDRPEYAARVAAIRSGLEDRHG
jgi:[ribosomal protein S18]-alanine N-acetyltransferase